MLENFGGKAIDLDYFNVNSFISPKYLCYTSI